MDIITSSRSLLSAFGGAVRFGNPPFIRRSSGMRLLGAGLQGRIPRVHVDGDGDGDRYMDLAQLAELDAEAAAAVRDILRRCLTPDNIRLTIGDVIRVDRLEDPFYGIITDTAGVVMHVDCRGCLVSDVPVIVLFGTDDFEVVGHEEFTRGVLDTETPEEAYEDFCRRMASGGCPEVFCKRWPAGSGSSLEKALGEGVRGLVFEYLGIEVMVVSDENGGIRVHPAYAWKDENGKVLVTDTSASRD